MSKITYANKEAINVDASIPNKNKGTADDFNEIKKVVNENDDHQIGIIKNICATLPATTGYVEGDNVYLMNDNDNLIYTLTNGAWVSAGAPNSNKYYLLINNMTNNFYYDDYYWKYTKGLYSVDDSGRLGKKIEDFSNVLSDYADFEELSSGTYLMYDLNNNGCSVLYPTRRNQTGMVNCPSLSMVSIYKQDETTVSVGDCFLLRSADNKIILGTVTNVTTTVKTWSIKYYYNALQVRKSTDASPVNMYQIFKDYTGSPTQTPLWILDDTFTLNYTDFATQEAKTFTFDKGDMVQGNSKECVDGVPMIVSKINGERYKITNLTVTGTTYLITKLDEDIYSTNEQRIGTWIDGKPLYRKVVDCGAMPNTTTKQVAHGISNLDFILDIRGAAYNTTHNGFPLPYTVTGATTGVSIFYDVANITIATSSDRSAYVNSYVILEYTKTTD